MRIMKLLPLAMLASSSIAIAAESMLDPKVLKGLAEVAGKESGMQPLGNGEREYWNDGWINVKFYNGCPFPIRVGRMGQGDFAYLESWGSADYGVGGEGQFHPSYAFYGYKHDAHPGFGNMTLAEFTFNTDYYHLDFFDVSQVDGHNLPIDMRAIGVSCPISRCAVDLLPGCPDGNRIWQNGWTIGCTKWGDKDNPNNPAAVHFRNHCPSVYSWSKDDQATQACAGEDYQVTFCPAN